MGVTIHELSGQLDEFERLADARGPLPWRACREQLERSCQELSHLLAGMGRNIGHL